MYYKYGCGQSSSVRPDNSFNNAAAIAAEKAAIEIARAERKRMEQADLADQRGMEAAKRGDWSEAANQFIEALGFAPESSKIRAQLDEANAKLADIASAEEILALRQRTQDAIASAKIEALRQSLEEDIAVQKLTAINEALSKETKSSKTRFTGKRAYHLTAKSWIDTNAIAKPDLILADWTSNTEPRLPLISPGGRDYKIAQSFVVEVQFTNGKVASAKYLKDSLVTEAGYSSPSRGLPVKGEVEVRTVVTSALGGDSVTFTRTITGHSKVLWALEVFTGSTPDIWNSITVEVYADKVVKHGDASDFPTTYFWIGDEMFDPKFQVQPSEFFK